MIINFHQFTAFLLCANHCRAHDLDGVEEQHAKDKYRNTENRATSTKDKWARHWIIQNLYLKCYEFVYWRRRRAFQVEGLR